MECENTVVACSPKKLHRTPARNFSSLSSPTTIQQYFVLLIINAPKLSTRKKPILSKLLNQSCLVTFSECSAKIGIITSKLERKELFTVQQLKLKEKASKSG